jgi:hypothetical protein
MAKPGDTVTIRPSGGEHAINFASSASSYIIVDGFIIDGSNLSHEVIKITYTTVDNASHHIRIQNSEIKNAPFGGGGILVSGQSSHFNEFKNLIVHNNGFGGGGQPGHGFYIQTDFNLIEGCTIHSNAGHGIQLYSDPGTYSFVPDNNIVRQNRVYGNVTRGIGVYHGSNNQVYNNLIWNNDIGIRVTGANGLAANNTVYNNRNAGILVDVPNNSVINNIVFGNPNNGIEIGAAISGISIRNNLSSNNGVNYRENSGGGASLSNNLFGNNFNPNFFNLGSYDFRLQSGSNAIDTGMQDSRVVVDFNSASRPLGLAQDIGAFESQ